MSTVCPLQTLRSFIDDGRRATCEPLPLTMDGGAGSFACIDRSPVGVRQRSRSRRTVRLESWRAGASRRGGAWRARPKLAIEAVKVCTFARNSTGSIFYT